MARIAILAIAALTLTGCAATTPVDDGTVSVVASTNVYGSIAEAIGGDLVTVTSIIDSAAQDPHSYEASASDQLAISKADLIIENGGGYDPFIDTLIDASSASAIVINASESSGLLEDDHDHDEAEHEEEADHEDEADHDGHDHIEGFNEHVWYSIHAVEHISEQIATDLSTIDPSNATVFAANLESFHAQLETLETQLDELQSQVNGAGAAITEPVPLYLLEDAGFTNLTPDEFSEAIEEGSDVAPLVLQSTLAVLTDVSLLAYNSQTASPETEQIREAAEALEVPVVEFTETLPDGEDYISWMTLNIAAIIAAG